jgi:HEPN domain-containing protein
MTKSKSISSELMRRLAFVRYLYEQASEQSRGPEPLATVAVLTLHDAAEMFLQIVAEHHQVFIKKKEKAFMDYWSSLMDKGVELTEQRAMERLNAARVNLKHRGVFPAHSEIEGFRLTVSTFLTENAQSALAVDFDRLSLTHLLRSERVKSKLEQAEASLRSNDLTAAMADAAQAFVLAINEYRERPRRDGLWTRGHDLHSLFSSFKTLMGVRNPDSDLRHFAKSIENAGYVLAEAITIVGYNLDFEDYLLFKSHSPIVHQTGGGGLIVEWTRSLSADAELVRRCVAFVLDTAIRLESRS